MSNFCVVHFVPAHREASILALPIQKAIAAPHRQEHGTNHWCFYFLTSSSTSVQFDCQPTHSVPSTVIQGGSKANLIIAELPCEVSNDTLAQFNLDVKPGLLVRHVYDHITQHARHKYEFDPDGVGCRCWVSGQLDLLFHLGVFTRQSQLVAAQAGILKLWPDQTPLALDQGAYYS